MLVKIKVRGVYESFGLRLGVGKKWGCSEGIVKGRRIDIGLGVLGNRNHT